MNVAILGCGYVAEKYLLGLKCISSARLVGVCDEIFKRACSIGEAAGVRVYPDLDSLLAEPEIDLIINLTTPTAHFATTLAALRADKHVFCEKPLAINEAETIELIATAQRRSLLLAAAPDTFLSPAYKAASHAIKEGLIGEPVAFSATLACFGHEVWHPRPQQYYQLGGGPLFDFGPYLVTHLIGLLGPVVAVQAVCRRSPRDRHLCKQSGDRTNISVDVATHYEVILEMANGATGTAVMSYDIAVHGMPDFEIYGTAGTLRLPTPDGYGTAMQVFSASTGQWTCYHDALWILPPRARGAGIEDMITAAVVGREPAASATRALTVLRILHAIDAAARSGERVEILPDFEGD